jgi:hypothetical protein
VNATVAQLEEQRSRKAQATGSNPVRGAQEIARRTRAILSYQLLLAGHNVLQPLFDCGYDLAIDRMGALIRVQCRTARIEIRDTLVFKTLSHGPVDAYAVWCRDNNLSYLVPAEGLSQNDCHLRLALPKNNQMKSVRMAEPYLLRPAGW